ncbi:type IV pilin protein [Halanaerobium kushneri]|uniref:General secretion pathway protein G n=1 Tax=Halanaerobium kushneri TaxID=56779 RepID=A0A1N6Q5H6_9FIRM|nr:prepilin-type N-terminal cleavage/methylation domain-containing protein [Halanaerobium kushneri]SIQ11848.1 general secretion pathway protein G [Halanaerobium kushneri]
MIIESNLINRNLTKNEEGFTLIELLIVIVVLGILMSMAVPALSGVKNKADTAVAKADLHNIMQSLEMYYLDHGEYPGQSTKSDISSISSDLTELNIKNSETDYSYQSDSDTGAEKYIIIYQAAADEFYYISTAESSLTGPEATEPTL